MRPHIPPALFAPQPCPRRTTPRATRSRSRARRCSRPPASTRTASRACSGDVMGRAVDYADLYFQLIARGVLGARGRHRQGRRAQHRAGRRRARARRREDRLRLLRRDRAAGAARGGARGARHRALGRRAARCRPGAPRGGRGLYLPIDPLESLDDDDKVALLERIDRETRALDPRVSAGDGEPRARRTTSILVAGERRHAGRATCGRWCASTSRVIVEQDGRREQGYAGGGGRFALHGVPGGRALALSWRARRCARRWSTSRRCRRRPAR